jgi:hypothetical protein
MLDEDAKQWWAEGLALSLNDGVALVCDALREDTPVAAVGPLRASLKWA